MPDPDPYNLGRFVAAQEPVYKIVLAELRVGAKRSHWMWFIFPQFEGLGQSPTSRFYSIKSLDEARRYLAHPVLGPRLLECAETILTVKGRSALEILGSPDDLKLKSSMTLFASAAGAGAVFASVLDEYFGGEQDQRTLQLLARRQP